MNDMLGDVLLGVFAGFVILAGIGAWILEKRDRKTRCPWCHRPDGAHAPRCQITRDNRGGFGR